MVLQEQKLSDSKFQYFKFQYFQGSVITIFYNKEKLESAIIVIVGIFNHKHLSLFSG